MEELIRAKNIIEKSQSIFIFPAKDPQGDALGSSLALSYTLRKLGKNVNLFLESVPEKFLFLTSLEKNFVISINTQGKEVGEMRYEKNHQDLKIYLNFKSGGINENDVLFAAPAAPLINKNISFADQPDLLITVGSGTLEDLGNFFSQNPRFFYDSSILNINNGSAGENFGDVNLVETNSCSIAEITTDLIKALSGSMLDEKSATYLLAGIICASQNFRNPRSRPKTFETASSLIKIGANHQTIIQHLYKTKSLPQIKLLGRVLENLKLDAEKDLYSASLTEADFLGAEASPQDIGPVVEELKFNFWTPASFSTSSSFLVLWESHASPSIVKGILYSPKISFIESVLANFEGTSRGQGALFLIREPDLQKAEKQILNILPR